MLHLIAQELKKPYGPLVPWTALAFLLLVTVWLIHALAVEPAERRLVELESEWRQARSEYQYHWQAQQAKKDLEQVWSALPDERDFAPLALGITEEANRNHVTLPALSYKTETTPVATISRGLLQGTMTGRYEDIRRFLYEIETAEELVYVEDLDLVQPAGRQDRMLTFNIKIASYLKASSSQAKP